MNTAKNSFRLNALTLTLLLSTLNPQLSTVLAQGPLTPPGAPAPVFKTLTQVEPRNDVQKLSGDATNLFVISQPGAYYLTANVNGGVGRNGISIQSDNVTLDLNGFAVIGAVGALRGITVSGSRVNVVVRNGIVKNWPSDGVDLSNATTTEVKEVLSQGNTAIGIAAGDTTVVSDCVARSNGGDNIRTGSHAVVTRCSAVLSTSGNGINCGGFAVISQCAANFNNQDGIRTIQRARVSECTTTNNTQSGVHITFTGAVERCFGNQNGNCGILMDGGGFVDILNNNCAEQNGAGNAGIRVTGAGGCRVEGNNVVSNTTGIEVTSARNVIFRNVGAGNGTDFNIVGGNAFGPIVNAVGAGDVSALAGANQPTANFRY